MTGDRQIFGPGDKLTWIEQIVRDRGCTGCAVRVAVELSRHTNTKTGEATVTQATMAASLGISERWVREAMKILRQRGHGEVINLAMPGPGRPSTFWPRIRPRAPGNTGTILPVEPRKDPSGDGSEHRKDCAATPEELCTNIGSYASSISNTKIPTDSPTARARAVDTTWMAVRKRLADEVGADVFEAWFGTVALAGIANGVVTLKTPSKFISSYIERNFYGRTLLAWQAYEPAVTALRCDHHAAALSADIRDDDGAPR